MKLHLNLSQLGDTEILTKEESKKVLGGMGSSDSGSGQCYMRCTQDEDSFAVSDCSRETYEKSCPNGSYGSCAC